MSSSTFFYGLGNVLDTGLSFIYDNVGNIINYGIILLISFGLVYWLTIQKKLNQQAQDNPDQRK